jgi:PHD/YefM family antitoxin component YafN of YafNO toxin-antitoxin module
VVEPAETNLIQLVPSTALPGQVRTTVDDARPSGRTVVVTEQGEPAGVLLDLEEYSELVSLAGRAQLLEDIKRGEEAIAKGELVNWEDVKRTTLGWLQDR